MGQIWFYTLSSILLVSLVSLVGIVALIIKDNFFQKIQTLLVSFAIGSLLGGAILHLIPESLENEKTSSVLVLVSIVIFFILEKYFHLRRHKQESQSAIKSFGPLNLLADGFHNFLDGILLAAAYSVNIHTGLIATVAVLAHELPQEIGDFAVLLQAGYTKKRALFLNLITALSSMIGGILVLISPLFGNKVSPYILPLAAGGFIYIALADLIPELNHTKSVKKSIFQVIAILLGLTTMWILLNVKFLSH